MKRPTCLDRLSSLERSGYKRASTGWPCHRPATMEQDGDSASRASLTNASIPFAIVPGDVTRHDPATPPAGEALPTIERWRSVSRRHLLGALVGLLVVAAGALVVSSVQARIGVVPDDLGVGFYCAFYASLIAVHAGGFWLWKCFASRHGVSRSLREAMIDAGLMTIGKYFPGKIWGLLGRGALDGSRLTLAPHRVAVSTAEQLVVLWCGAMIAAAAWVLLERDGGAVSIMALLVLALLLPVVPWITSVIATRCLFRLPSLREFPVLPARSWLSLIAGYALLWAMNPIPLLIIAEASVDLTRDDAIRLSVAFIVSMLAGWAALFAPAGIGVREAAFVSLAPSAFGWESCLYWIALHRTLSTVLDLLIGTATLWSVSSRTRAKGRSNR